MPTPLSHSIFTRHEQILQTLQKQGTKNVRANTKIAKLSLWANYVPQPYTGGPQLGPLYCIPCSDIQGVPRLCALYTTLYTLQAT